MFTRGSLRLACSLALGSLLGFAISCKGSKSPDGWYDACCAQCSEGHCLECNASKGDCEEQDLKHAECIEHDAGLMCREKVG